MITVLPKNLFEQFQRLANAYFLILLILQLIPQISSLNPITTILPLSCVLILKALKDLIDDIVSQVIILFSFKKNFYKQNQTKQKKARHRNDNSVNSRPCSVLRGNRLKDETWSQIVVGDIVKLTNNDFVTVDSIF